MVSLSLKNIPEDLMQGLRQAASQDCRSLNQEVLYILKCAIRARTAKNEFSGLTDLVKQNLIDLPWDDE